MVKPLALLVAKFTLFVVSLDFSPYHPVKKKHEG